MTAFTRRTAQRRLAAWPQAYLRLLDALGRGSMEKRAYLALVRSGDVVLDVGANEGYYTLLFSDLVGSAGRVHAFEPVHATFERLAQRIQAEPSTTPVRLIEAACTDTDGSVTIFVPGGDSAQASLAPHAVGSWSPALTAAAEVVAAIRLDTYLCRIGCRRLDFVKCDAEGAELLVLRGMRQMLAAHMPILSLEVCDAWTRDFNYSAADLIAFVSELGYDRLHAVSDGVASTTPAALTAQLAAGTSITLLAGVDRRHADRLATLQSRMLRGSR